MTKPDGREPYLDGLRGVAACVVLVEHLSVALKSPLSVVFNGNSAVCVFFVLSGYVLTDLSQKSGLSFPALAVRRYVRLVAPMLAVSLFAWALLVANLYSNRQAAVIIPSAWLGWWYNFEPSFTGMVSETVYGVFVRGESSYNCNLWTMRPELIGSLYIFIVNTTVTPRGLRSLCYIALAVGFPSGYLPLFSFGAILFEYKRDLTALLRKTPAVPIAFLVAGGLLCLMSEYGSLGRLFSWLPRLSTLDNDIHWHMIGAFGVVFGTLYWPLAQTVLSSWLGRFLGRISFTLYLIQIPIICSLTPWLFLTLLPVSPWIAAKAAGVASFALIVGASGVTYRVIDLLPTRASRRIGTRLDAILAFGLGKGDRSKLGTGTP